MGVRPEPSREVAVEAILEEKLRRNYNSLHDAFRALDRTNNGWVSRSDFLDAVSQVLLVDGYGQADIDEVGEHFGLHSGGVLSYAEFASLLDGVEPPPDAQEHGERVQDVDVLLQVFKEGVDQRYNSFTHAFRSLDKDHDASLNLAEVDSALRLFGISASSAHVDALYHRLDPKGSGRVSYAAFCKALSGAPQFEAHLKRQMFHPPPRAAQ